MGIYIVFSFWLLGSVSMFPVLNIALYLVLQLVKLVIRIFTILLSELSCVKAQKSTLSFLIPISSECSFYSFRVHC